MLLRVKCNRRFNRKDKRFNLSVGMQNSINFPVNITKLATLLQTESPEPTIEILIGQKYDIMLVTK